MEGIRGRRSGMGGMVGKGATIGCVRDGRCALVRVGDENWMHTERGTVVFLGHSMGCVCDHRDKLCLLGVRLAEVLYSKRNETLYYLVLHSPDPRRYVSSL
jgi:hypothetical protein